jgi:hypothetical protein
MASSCAHPCACTRRKGDEPPALRLMASFTRSRDPCASIVTILRRRKSSEVAHSKRDRGWANPGNREEPAPSLERMGVARLAVRHRSRKGGQRGALEKEGGCGLRPCENQESRLGCPHVVNETLLQKSVGGVWSQIRSAYALQKERQG